MSVQNGEHPGLIINIGFIHNTRRNLARKGYNCSILPLNINTTFTIFT